MISDLFFVLFFWIVYLASTFALVDDLQSVLPSCRVLHTFSDHCKVAVSQHASHLVSLRDVGWHSWNLIHNNLSCEKTKRMAKTAEQQHDNRRVKIFQNDAELKEEWGEREENTGFKGHVRLHHQVSSPSETSPSPSSTGLEPLVEDREVEEPLDPCGCGARRNRNEREGDRKWEKERGRIIERNYYIFYLQNNLQKN